MFARRETRGHGEIQTDTQPPGSLFPETSGARCGWPSLCVCRISSLRLCNILQLQRPLHCSTYPQRRAARSVQGGASQVQRDPDLGSSGIKFEVEGEGGSTGADTYIPLQKSGTFFLHFSQKIEILQHFSENKPLAAPPGAASKGLG